VNRRPRFAVRVVPSSVEPGDFGEALARWLYWSGAIGIQTGPREARHKGTRREARELVAGAKKWLRQARSRGVGAVNLTGLREGDRFAIVRLTPRGLFPHAATRPVVPEESSRRSHAEKALLRLRAREERRRRREKGRGLREFLAGLVRTEWRDATETNALWPQLARWIEEGGPTAFSVDLNKLYLALRDKRPENLPVLSEAETLEKMRTHYGEPPPSR
jgi:hypothetical protein